MPDPEWRFGLEIDRGYDAGGYRRKEAALALTRCPACGKTLFLIADTESWTEGEGGRWEHDQYGPAEAICCGRLVVDFWDGCYVYRLAEDQQAPRCHAGRDGDCNWAPCPQERDGEPAATGRHCPLDTHDPDLEGR